MHASERGAVTVIAPGAAELTATAWAQGGVAAVAAADDSPERHAADTIAAGAGLCDPAAVDVLVREAPEAVAELRAMGMRFDESDSALEGGHSRRRVHHAGGDRSGRALHRFLEEEVERHARIVRVDARAVAIEMRDGVASGVRIEGGALVAADRVVLATGGACGIFGRRTGPDTSVGEGMALAWHAGAALADLEFVQFHPTALDVPGRPARLLTEALRGEGAVLRDAAGERFMDRFHPQGDLAPRDVVARAVLQVREETGAPVYLDATAVPDVADAVPDGRRAVPRGRAGHRHRAGARRAGGPLLHGRGPDRPVGPDERAGAVRRRRGREHRGPRREPARVELAGGGAGLRPARGDRRRRGARGRRQPVDALDAEPGGRDGARARSATGPTASSASGATGPSSTSSRPSSSRRPTRAVAARPRSWPGS